MLKPNRPGPPPTASVAPGKINAIFVWDANSWPDPNYIVTRYPDGRPLSYFSDDIWDLTPYEKVKRSRIINFESFRIYSENYALEAKRLVFLIMQKPNGKPFEVGTLLNYVAGVKRLVEHCHGTDQSLFYFLSSSSKVLAYARTEPTGAVLKILSALLGLVRSYKQTPPGISRLGRAIQQAVRECYDGGYNQTPPIPTEILSYIIVRLQTEISEFLAVEERFLALARLCAANKFAGRKPSSRIAISKRNNVANDYDSDDIATLIASHSLQEYFTTKGLSFHVNQISRHLSEIYLVCKLLIHAFSGMRDEEVSTLPYDCREMSASSGLVHYLIKGITTKLAGGHLQVTRWVTCSEGHQAIDCAAKISKLVYEFALGPKFEEKLDDFGNFLFVTPFRLFGAANRLDGSPERFQPSNFDLTRYPTLRQRILPNISADDLEQLEQIDPYRDWASEDSFAIGVPWPLTTHQFRRSLALYAHRSGLVSFPTLRRQLKHIRDAMAMYYAKGSGFADNFIGDDPKHFGREWRANKTLSEGLSYWVNVVQTDEPTYGGHSQWLKNRLASGDNILLSDRATTIKLFKRGELAYKETFLGGCTSTVECKSVGIDVMNLECLTGCKNLVGNKNKLIKIIFSQKLVVKAAPKDSVEYRTERKVLSVLEAALDATN